MKIKINVLGTSQLYCVLTLCSYGDSGDFEAFPTAPLEIAPIKFAESLKAAGCSRVRYNESRIVLEYEEAEITVFQSGRMILEGVSPSKQKAAAGLIQKLMTIYDLA